MYLADQGDAIASKPRSHRNVNQKAVSSTLASISTPITAHSPANPCCSHWAETCGAITRPAIIPARVAPINITPSFDRLTPWLIRLPKVPSDTSATTIKDVDTTAWIRTSLNLRNAGTIKNPPPTLNNPVSNPEVAPMDTRVMLQRAFQVSRPVAGLSMQFFSSTPRLPSSRASARACRNMRTETNIITALNINTSTLAGINRARCSPMGEVVEPTSAINAAAL